MKKHKLCTTRLGAWTLLFAAWIYLPSMAMKGGQPTPHNSLGMSSKYPASFGFEMKRPTGGGGNCSGCRVGPNLYLTAGHCLSSINMSGVKVDILSSSGKKISNIAVKKVENMDHPYSSSTCMFTGGCHDFGLFELNPTQAQAELVDKHLDIAALRRDTGSIGDKVTITNAGCKNPTNRGHSCTALPDGTRLNYDDGELHYIDQEIKDYGASADFLYALFGVGEEDYAYIEAPVFMAKGDSGGCVYDGNNFVIGVNSHGRHHVGDPNMQDAYYATFRTDDARAWLETQMSKQCVVAGETIFGTDMRCRATPKNPLGNPDKRVHVIRIDDGVRHLAACRKAERSSYCGHWEASAGQFECIQEAAAASAPCLTNGLCAAIDRAPPKCQDFVSP